MGVSHPPLVVVVAYHGAEELALALDPLRGLDVLVVDNSASAAVRAVAERCGVAYLDSGGNVGFARAVNLALARAGGRDVVLVNPDAVVDPAVVDQLVRRLHAEPLVAAAAPALTGADGVPQRVRWPFPTPRGAWLQAVGLGGLTGDGEGFLIGAVLALNGAAVEQIGGFDPSYFLYAEETDWQRRAVAAGWTLVLDTSVSALHVGGTSSSDETRREVHFHAGAERYVRRWHGRRGWFSYRLATWAGSAARGVALRGERGRVARRRAGVYATGPLRRERRVTGVGRSVVHVVLTAAFAGTERLVVTEAAELARRGWVVTVIGGDPGRMRAELGAGVVHLPASSVAEGVRQLGRVGQVDVVHAHLTAAEVAAVAARPWNRAPVVATRHIAAARGSSRGGRLVAPLVRRGLSEQIAISSFVAGAVGEVCTVVHNGVPPVTASGVVRERTVLVLQRLEAEKSTEVALRAWAASGLAGHGWRMVVAGDGSQREQLVVLVDQLGVQDSVDVVGWVEDTSMLLERAGVLLATAPAEPFGLSVVEAMAHGVPVVAANGGAHREVLGEGGVVFPPGDAQAAGRVLADLAMDAAGRLARGAELADRYRHAFTVPQHVDGIEQVYLHLPLARASSTLLGRWARLRKGSSTRR